MVQLAGDPTHLNMIALMPLVYILPAYALYFVEIYVMFLHSSSKVHFKSAFYCLFLTTCILNVVDSFCFYLFYRTNAAPIFVPIYKTLPESHFLITFNLFATYYSTYAVDMVDMVMSFNRFTVVALKSNYKKFWKVALKYFLGAALTAPLFFCFHIWFTDVRIKIIQPGNPDFGFQYDEFHKEVLPWINNATYMASITIFCGSVSFLCNLYVGVVMLWKRNKSEQTLQIKTQEKTLIFYTFMTLTGHMLMFTHQLTWMSTDDLTIGTALFKTLAYVFDFITLAPAVFMFIINGRLRQEILRVVFGCTPVTKVVSLTASTNDNGLSLASAPATLSSAVAE